MTDDKRSLEHLLNITTKTIFKTQDFNKLWKYDNYSSLIQRISYLEKTGKIDRIKRGLYSIKGREVHSLELANNLRTPSYVSFETVFNKENIIFQWDSKITLAGKESIVMEVLGFKVFFRQLKDSVLLNRAGIKREGNYYIATKERAVADMLYINPDFAFDNLRPIDFSKLERLVEVYGRKSILKLVKDMKRNA